MENEKSTEKIIYNSLTICSFCAYEKLNEDIIKEILIYYRFNNNPCNDCKNKYKINLTL